MSISDISIKNPVFAWMLMAGLMLFGLISYNRMGISQLPDVDFPVVNINVTYEGASSEIMETDIADVIEDAVMSVEGIQEVRSTSRDSSTSITVELDINRNVDVALQEVQTKIAQAQRLLPKDIDPPIISKRNPEDFPIMWIALTSDRPLKEMMVFTRYELRDKFQTISGVADVRLGGYVDRNLRIWVDKDKLSLYDLTVDDIINTIGREHVEVPGGRMETTGQEFVIRSLGEAYTVDAVANLPITLRGGSPVFSRILIKDVARVEDNLDDIRRISRFNGERAIGLGIIKQRKSNAIAIADDVRKLLDTLNPQLPKGYKLQITNDMTRFIKDSTSELVFTIFLSTILTSLVCFLFLGSFSSTINIILAIPTSLLGTFIVLYFAGFTLNTFTLMALSLVIGVVVDDAIMVLENITRYREMGQDKVIAAGNGARQITFAALASTLAIIAIFLPVAFMSGIIGKYFLEFGVTISIAVILSLLEALTLTPMRCSQFLEINKRNSILNRGVNRAFDALSVAYHKALAYTLDHRWTVIITASAIFFSSLLLLGMVKKEFIPAMDQSQFILRLKTPVGSSISVTDESTKKIETLVRSINDVKSIYCAVGGFGGGETNSAMIFVNLKQPKDRPVDPKTGKRRSQNDVMIDIRKQAERYIDEMKISIQDLSMRGFSASRGYPVEFVVQGPDWDRLSDYSTKIADEMKKSGKMVDVDTSYDLGQPEINIIPNRIAAEERGVSMTSIGNAVGAMIGGKIIGKFTEGGHRYDIRIRLADTDRRKINDIKKIFVRNNRGELVRLSEVVDVVSRRSMLSISRVNRARSITIYANPSPTSSQQEALNYAITMARKMLPEGYRVDVTGTAKTSGESFSSLTFALIIGIIVAYMILGSQFNSYIHPFTVLLALPFSFTGAIIALVITGQTINMYSFIGLILLMGLVKKNSILLVEFTNQMRHEGLSVKEALLKACPVRLRPIVMTTLSTIAAAIPPAIAVGPGAESRIPMAVAVLGGVIFSTVLTLVVVPAAYSLLSRLEYGKDNAGKE
ncbi:MAG: multidrug transporter AcrB [Spirochaetae bacterium HGW-Spirochaetae-1]|jgi:HAE1 family hydrophobic/amphiphilic exporter-1|nr:MAG: multidrug transporter AcrB [Spirochaetae bacterium HGW-Spirochaetae-1]